MCEPLRKFGLQARAVCAEPWGRAALLPTNASESLGGFHWEEAATYQEYTRWSGWVGAGVCVWLLGRGSIKKSPPRRNPPRRMRAAVILRRSAALHLGVNYFDISAITWNAFRFWEARRRAVFPDA